MKEISDEAIEEIIDNYDKAQSEYKTTTEKDYWQGRKDGLRIALALIEPEKRHWKQLNDTSYGFHSTEKEIIQNFVKNIRYNTASILWEIREEKKINSLTVGNLLSWIYQYDILAKQGLFVEVEDACM